MNNLENQSFLYDTVDGKKYYLYFVTDDAKKSFGFWATINGCTPRYDPEYVSIADLWNGNYDLFADSDIVEAFEYGAEQIKK